MYYLYCSLAETFCLEFCYSVRAVQSGSSSILFNLNDSVKKWLEYKILMKYSTNWKLFIKIGFCVGIFVRGFLCVYLDKG